MQMGQHVFHDIIFVYVRHVETVEWQSVRGFDDSANNWPRSEIKKLKEKLNN